MSKVHTASKLEAQRTSWSNDKLLAQIKELQQQHQEDWLKRSVLQRQVDSYAEQIKRMTSLHDTVNEQTRTINKLEAQLADEKKESRAVRDEFHARMLGQTGRLTSTSTFESGLLGRDALPDDIIISAFGELLKRSMLGKSAPEANKIKRQLLFCFHPDKNPAGEIAN